MVVFSNGSSWRIVWIDVCVVRGSVLLNVVEIRQRRLVDTIDSFCDAILDGNA